MFIGLRPVKVNVDCMTRRAAQQAFLLVQATLSRAANEKEVKEHVKAMPRGLTFVCVVETVVYAGTAGNGNRPCQSGGALRSKPLAAWTNPNHAESTFEMLKLEMERHAD